STARQACRGRTDRPGTAGTGKPRAQHVSACPAAQASAAHPCPHPDLQPAEQSRTRAAWSQPPRARPAPAALSAWQKYNETVILLPPSSRSFVRHLFLARQCLGFDTVDSYLRARNLTVLQGRIPNPHLTVCAVDSLTLTARIADTRIGRLW